MHNHLLTRIFICMLFQRYMGIGLSAQGVNMNRLPGESLAKRTFFCSLDPFCDESHGGSQQAGEDFVCWLPTC